MTTSTSKSVFAAAILGALAAPGFGQEGGKPQADQPPTPPVPGAPGDVPKPPELPRPPAPPLPPGNPGEFRQRPPEGDRPDGPGRRERQERPDRPDRPPFGPREGDRPGDSSPGRDRERGRGRPDDFHPDGPDRQRGGDRERDHSPRGETGPGDRGVETPRKPMPYLGVVTSSAPPVLAAQLGLSQGFGLTVDEVLPDSPAQTAGVQRYDVLKLLNDQQLTEPGQLAALVRGVGKDAEATLTVIRKGQEQKITIKVGEKMLPDYQGRDARGFGGMSPFGGDRREQFDMLRRDHDMAPGMRMAPERFRAWRERMRGFEDEMRRYQDRLREWQKKPEGEVPKAPELPPLPSADVGQDPGDEAPARGGGVRPADLLRELRPGASADLRADWRDGSSHWDASRARMVMKDRDGEVEVAVKDGHRVLTAKSAQGDQVFSGPVDTLEQRNAVPQPFRGKLEALEIRQRPPGPPRGNGGENEAASGSRPQRLPLDGAPGGAQVQ